MLISRGPTEGSVYRIKTVALAISKTPKEVTNHTPQPSLRVHLEILDGVSSGIQNLAVHRLHRDEPVLVRGAVEFAEPIEPDVADFADLVVRHVAEEHDFRAR